MASGDIFSDMRLDTSGGTIDVQPAASVNVVITFIGGTEHSQILGKNSVGSFIMSANKNDGSNAINKYTLQSGYYTTSQTKLFLTNDQYIAFESGSGQSYFAYSGIEL